MLTCAIPTIPRSTHLYINIFFIIFIQAVEIPKMIQLAFKLLADFGPPVPARTSEMDLAAVGSVGVGVGVGVVPADRTVATSRALAPAYRPAVRGSISSTSSTASTQTARKQRAFDAFYLGSIPVTKSVGSAVVLRAVRTSDLYFWVNSRNLMEQSQHYIYICGEPCSQSVSSRGLCTLLDL